MRSPITAPTPTVSAQNYLGELITAAAAGLIVEAVKQLFDKRKDRSNQETDHTNDGDAEQQE
ncbi:hypothetical protein [Streptomyces griseofuscus]|uniref:hypothetical protein n=1 Tax=Streptomyces griseofuscus TaxID=146922 RepID=UPI0036C85774